MRFLSFDTDAGAARFWLVTPVLLVIPALMVVVMMFMIGGIQKGDASYWIGGIAFAYVIAAVFWGPGWAVAYWLFWRKSRSHEPHAIEQGLNRFPLIIAAGIWFPVCILIPMQGFGIVESLRAYGLLAVLAIVIGYPFVLAVRALVLGPRSLWPARGK